MNLRQKAKRYKKEAESNAGKASAYDMLMRTRAFEREAHKRIYGTVETVKVVKYWDDRFPDTFVRNEIAHEFGKICLENNLIYFEVEDNYNEYNGLRRVIGTLRVAKKWGDDNGDSECTM